MRSNSTRFQVVVFMQVDLGIYSARRSKSVDVNESR